MAYEAWRKQFRGKTAADSLRVGKEYPQHFGGHDQRARGDSGVRSMLADLTTWHHKGAIR